MTTVVDLAPFGELLRYWRGLRRSSQLDLAVTAGTTPRYVSFVETGRSRPSREMVVRLARALDVPLRERNGLLLAAGYAPHYRDRSLDDGALARVDAAVTAMLDHHEPFPGVVMDRGWAVLRANGGARRLFGELLAPAPVPDRANVLRLFIEPGPIRDAVVNWPDVAAALLERARREATGGVLDADTAGLVTHLTSLPDVAAAIAGGATEVSSTPVIDVRFRLADATWTFFSIVSTIGTPTDVTAQELRVEAFFPADEATAAGWAQRA